MKNADKGSIAVEIPSECEVSIDSYVHTRRCFMTGEYCSQLVNIQQERQNLYEGNEDNLTINAFVIMNFSDMSDVVYEWRIKPFIESLVKYLQYDKDKKILKCFSKQIDEINANKQKGKKGIQIRVVRSDTDPASNYVICNRICQQLQIADLVIVDVSTQNPNVFYEFGMAVALGKLILPICYSNSFYKRHIPYDENAIQKVENPKREQNPEKHIGCYPWRKTLYEYYGIRYKRSGFKTEYMEYDYATKAEYKFGDIDYARFPYDEIIDGKMIGQAIYEGLKDWYNKSGYDGNTLVVYTMEGFLNAEQAGRCIVNFNHFITKPMAQGCFCGERVGVLVQNHPIPENDKDTKEKLQLLYNTGEIIHIGMNEATFRVAERKVKASDVYKEPGTESPWFDVNLNIPSDTHMDNTIRNIKAYISNRGMIIYPKYPVYVERIKNNMTDDLMPVSDKQDKIVKQWTPFCLYHVMLRTLRYVNQLVVDISDNSSQALFWLGAAHGSDIYAVTVVHEYSDQERDMLAPITVKKNRSIFDVAGLWTAVYHSNDTRGFYQQLALVQAGIERHSKLLLSETEDADFNLRVQQSVEKLGKKHTNDKEMNDIIRSLLEKRRNRENEILESYYRKRFWTPMLRYNRLHIYLEQCDDEILLKDEYPKNVADFDNAHYELRARIPKWDFEAVSRLTNYLSTHTVIGEYRVVALQNKDDTVNKDIADAQNFNYMCIGGESLLAKKWFDSIFESIKAWRNESSMVRGDDINILHEWVSHPVDSCDGCPYSYTTPLRKQVGFECRKSFEEEIINQQPMLTDHYNHVCFNCNIKYIDHYNEIAQLILWRDDNNSSYEPNYYRVALSGASGTSTYALSELFVNDKSDETKTNKLTLLCDLQENIRTKFMDIYLLNLKNAIMSTKLTVGNSGAPAEETQHKSYCQLVLYTVSMYLSTVLYRYFFPFLSKRDQERIYNDLHTYIYSMKASSISPFAEHYSKAGEDSISGISVNAVINLILSKLEKTLKGFKGIEAFFDVEVVISENPQKSTPQERLQEKRSVKSIKLKTKNGSELPLINYFFDPTVTTATD